MRRRHTPGTPCGRMRKARMIAAWAVPWVPAGIDVDAPWRLAVKVTLLVAGVAASGAVMWGLEAAHRQHLALLASTVERLSRHGVPRPDLRHSPDRPGCPR